MLERKNTRMLTGLQPSGVLHIGNYFGSIKPLIELVAASDKEQLECFLMVADYHALTTVRDPEKLRNYTRAIVKDYLALGVDPERVVLFRQSANQDHMELAWIFNCLVSVPFLMQAHAYKDKTARGIDANAGLFTYPMLMAADITLYDTDIVPVGEDQRQHIEYTREAVNKFNNAYGEVLRTPKEQILPEVGVVPGIDGQKMSKSYHNTIPLFSTAEEISKITRKIVTDSSGKRPENVYALHQLFRQDKEVLDSFYEANAGQYKVLKDALAEDIEAFMAPLRDRRESLTDEYVESVITAGNEKAQTVSAVTLERVREAVGIL
jgi:tryptophanyl-tRNA synthetase